MSLPVTSLPPTCMSPGLQLGAHPLTESTAVSAALGMCRIGTHIWRPPLQDGQLSLKVAPEVVFDTPSYLLLSLPKGPGHHDSISLSIASAQTQMDTPALLDTPTGTPASA